MTADDRRLALARAKRVRCPKSDCPATLPVRVSCVPRWDGRYDVLTPMDMQAWLAHWSAEHREASDVQVPA